MTDTDRTRTAVAAAAAAIAAAATVTGVVLVVRGGGGPATTPTTPATTATTTATTPLPPSVPELPDWGAVAGAPPDFATPAGGDAAVTPTPDGSRVELTRDDGSTYAVARVDDDGTYRDIHYYDDAGRLRLAVDRVDVEPGPAAVRAGASTARCQTGSVRSGFRWTTTIPWRLDVASIPGALSPRAVLAAARSARTAWIRNRNRCRVRDRSGVAFRYRGTTGASLGQDGRNVIAFGEIDRLGGACVGAIACTFTWTRGNRAVESDILVDRNPRRGFAAGGRPGVRIDLRSVLVHETGHTIGLEHVRTRGNVMFPTLRAGDTAHRRLGRGDAQANNALY